ncbi:hypothetical protein CPB85DRAFT_1323037 [Mucidula mucida]|nr:hypothetical protein CPB85DRAFT_1323037 [Mucidula mucida]
MPRQEMPSPILWTPSLDADAPARTDDIPPDPIPTQRERLFDFNPPSLQRSESISLPIPSSPLHFMDPHIAQNLILKRVRILSSLGADLHRALNSFSEQLDALEDRHFYFHTDFSYDIQKEADARAIINLRKSGVTMASTQVASKVLIHNSQRELLTVLQWMDPSTHLKPTLIKESFASQNLAFGVFPPASDRFELFNRKNRAIIKRLSKGFYRLNSCMVFCTDGQPLMEAMSGLETMGTSRYSNDALPVPHPQPLDAATTLWTLPTTEGPRRSRRGRPEVAQRPKDVGPIETAPERDGVYTPKCEDYVQKAWVTAVKVDASTLIFDCGNFVRIGVRHRETQTLYLSDMIDIRSCKEPSYGGLMVALDMAVTFDALQRLPLLENDVLGKRKTTLPAQGRRSKRRKTSTTRLVPSIKDLIDTIGSFPLVAVFFRHDHFDSPAPLLLFPPGAVKKQRYEPREYISIVADRSLGVGAVGSVFRVTIDADLCLQDPEAGYPSFILKIATGEESIRRLRHEVHIYRHLEKAGVSCIPSLLGVRENAAADVYAIMLSDAGDSLAHRMDDEHKVYLSTKQKEELRAMLNSIHEAGVLHRDVRATNILEDHSGRLRFTDFDRGSLRAKSPDFVAEKLRLDKFIDGEYVERAAVIGEDDLSYSPSS